MLPAILWAQKNIEKRAKIPTDRKDSESQTVNIESDREALKVLPGLSFTIILERHMLYKILVCSLICTVPPPSDSIVSSGCYSKLNIFLEKGTQMAKAFASLFRSTFFSTVRQHLLSNCRERCQTFSPRCRGPPASEIKVFPNFRRTGGNSAWALAIQKKRTGLRQTGKNSRKIRRCWYATRSN